MSRPRLIWLGLLLALAAGLGGCGGGGGSNPPTPPPVAEAPSYVEAGWISLQGVTPQSLATAGRAQGIPKAPLERAFRYLQGARPQQGSPSVYLEAYWPRVQGARGYRVYLRVQGGTWRAIGEVDGQNTSVGLTLEAQLREGEAYEVGVSALGTRESSITPSAPLVYLGLPTLLEPRPASDQPPRPLFRWQNYPRAEGVAVLALQTDGDYADGEVFPNPTSQWRPSRDLVSGSYVWAVLNLAGRRAYQDPRAREAFGEWASYSLGIGGEFTVGYANRASISGRVRLSGSAENSAPLPQELARALEELRKEEIAKAMEELLQNPPEAVPEEVIVRFRPGTGVPKAGRMVLDEVGLEARVAKALALEGVYLMRLKPLAGPSRFSQEELPLQASLALMRRPEVVWAQPNFIHKANRVPDDPLYPSMWHYQAINLERTWDITVGSPRVVVAVLDTGILFDPLRPERSHPDLAGQVLPGYDFISDPFRAMDGDGRDPDPYDLDDEESYHGSHVAGTIAAASNNGIGITGVAWQAKIFAARVLGRGGGTTQDIAEAALWAAGLPVPGVPQNQNPAQIINMSLSGFGQCAAVPIYSETFSLILSRGVIVVVAAGNENDDASKYSPASCPGVLTVGSVNQQGRRAYYSNYGLRVDVMAPGGETTPTPQGGVLSLYRTPQGFGYTWYQGTSMAAPHVAGIVALMKAVKPSLTPQEAITVLKATAIPLTAEACRRPTAAECGAGLVNPVAALQALGQVPPPPVAGGLQGTLVAACVWDGREADCNRERGAVGVRLTTTDSESQYSLPGALRDRDYVVLAWLDANGNGVVDGGDFTGQYPRPVRPPATNVDFALTPAR